MYRYFLHVSSCNLPPRQNTLGLALWDAGSKKIASLLIVPQPTFRNLRDAGTQNSTNLIQLALHTTSRILRSVRCGQTQTKRKIIRTPAPRICGMWDVDMKK